MKQQERSFSLTHFGKANSACRWQSRAETSGYSQEITLADLDTIVPENAVGGRRMKIEIGKRNAGEKLLALQRHRSIRTNRKCDIPTLGAFELRRRETLDVVAGLRQSLSEFFERLFGVGDGRQFAAGEPGTRLAGEVAGELDLAR